MKYIDVNSVLKSYEGFQDCMTNKSWGYLALLKGCNNCIAPSTPYEINLDEVSNFLENKLYPNIFSFKIHHLTVNGCRTS